MGGRGFGPGSRTSESSSMAVDFDASHDAEPSAQRIHNAAGAPHDNPGLWVVALGEQGAATVCIKYGIGNDQVAPAQREACALGLIIMTKRGRAGNAYDRAGPALDNSSKPERQPNAKQIAYAPQPAMRSPNPETEVVPSAPGDIPPRIRHRPRIFLPRRRGHERSQQAHQRESWRVV
jgi:hypothetical protein